MVNFVELLKTLLHWHFRRAGLHRRTVEIEPGTVVSFWVPKHKANNDIVPIDTNGNLKQKQAVVLVHGFAADGMITWQLQVGMLAQKYDVYVPDLLFFGESRTESKDRSVGFQARCFLTALGRLGVEECTVVGFSYGGMVAFKMAEMEPKMVRALVVSGTVTDMTESINGAILERLGCSSFVKFLLPEDIKGLKAMFRVATYKKFWLPRCFYKDYLKVMFTNRKERAELLERMVIGNNDAGILHLQLPILLLWGENDNIFLVEQAKNVKEQLGENATLRIINNSGHLVHFERPCTYNQCLEKFLTKIHFGTCISS